MVEQAATSLELAIDKNFTNCGANVDATVSKGVVDLDVSPAAISKTGNGQEAVLRSVRGLRYVSVDVTVTLKRSTLTGNLPIICDSSHLGTDSMRLVVDGLSLKPVNFINETIRPNDGKAYTLSFAIPATAKSAMVVLGDERVAALKVPVPLPAMPAVPGE